MFLSPTLPLSLPPSHPSGDGQVVDAREVLPELQKLLEVLHLHHCPLQLEHHLRDISQGGFREKEGSGGREKVDGGGGSIKERERFKLTSSDVRGDGA